MIVNGNWTVVAQGHRSCGLFKSNRSYWCTLYGIKQSNRALVFQMLHHLAELMTSGWYKTKTPRQKPYPSQEWVLREFDGSTLRGTRCVRLFEYINFDLFNYDCLHVMGDDAMPDSRSAAEFLIRWERSFDVDADMQFGCMNEITEKDVAETWF